MRLTVELKPEHHMALRSLASERGERGISELVIEAIDEFLRRQLNSDQRRQQLLSMAGALSHDEAEDLRREATALRESWR